MDSSALISLVVERDPVDELLEFIESHPNVPIGTSTIGFTETVRGALQHGQYPRLMEELESFYGELTLSEEIRDLAAQIPGNIRTLDAIHVATALSIADYLTVLVSYDRRMLKIAEEQGLPTASPGMN
ncbi:type II toxin-antitoxin system VapC family toxin [Glycomyces arizonensis]|uniref:type II toxin-antitoxin system VapC family toxin n=1 Tax=Glycomyces arizonensis TaxID=256035 RepID=UPI000687CA3E|nr:type II toxin-antitoxin system VapC family toxin [Glycomyces arizonensis]